MSRRADRRYMGRALKLAGLGHGLTGINPSVGCVIVDGYGRIVAEASTGLGGRPHAEQIALDLAGERARDGTAYVTLEPCRERSTGEASCSERLVAAGLSRVVCAIADRHPKGAGGFDRLRKADIRLLTGLKKDQALRLYKDFFASQD